MPYLVLSLRETGGSGDYSQSNRPYFLNAKYVHYVFPIIMIPSVIVFAEKSVRNITIISSSCVLTPCNQFAGYGMYVFGTLNPLEPISYML